ncbi:MAG: hypothetical protein QOH96_1596, partial [Blastocatellia bacterium]|nr:hypothetical protein [Blastocatellia bacterium]
MKISSSFLVCLLITLSGTFAIAQSQLGTGTVTGMVVDTNSSVVAGATVTITNQETALTRTVVTTESGQFNFPVLPADSYLLTVEKQGFSRIEQRDLKVPVGGTVSLKLALRPGEVNEVVTVTGVPEIDVTRTDESSLISQTQINDLPINGRRADQFALLA